MAFTHLHVHTEFSLLDGSNRIKELFNLIVPESMVTEMKSMFLVT